MVLDINTTPLSTNAADLVAIGRTTYFSADDGVHGRELWKSNGTAAGTVMVADINPGSGGSEPSHLTNVNGTLFFAAADDTHGFELWKYDGAAVGTVMLADINAGGGDSHPMRLTNVGGTLFFAADDGIDGQELWKSDGTAAGTVPVKDINLGSTPSDPSNLTNVGGTLFFAADNGTDGTELWKSDGTSAGTSLVKDVYPGSYQGYYGGLRPANSFPSQLTNVNGTLFFAANDGTNGVELWKSDGTADGTTLVKDINPGSYTYDYDYSYPNSSQPRYLTSVGGTLFFAANDGTNGIELWKSDGTADGTTLVKDINPGSYTYDYGRSYAYSSEPKYLTSVGGTLFFAAYNDTNGVELWKSDGTADGTVMVADINPENLSSIPHNLTNVDGTLFFAADDGTQGVELWKSDGSEEGTIVVADINPGTPGSFPQFLTNADGTLFFLADDGTRGTQLWQSDGGSAGTAMVLDNAGNAASSPSNLTNVNGTLYFAADDGTHDAELWKSDGTAAGTTLVKDLFPGSPGLSLSYLTNVDGTVFFLAQGSLWRSDGTADGTIPLGSVVAPAQLTGSNGTLFFSSWDGTNGIELWKSDGTAGGTTVVKDIFPGGYTEYYTGYYGGLYSRFIPYSSNPNHLTNVNGTLYFTANDGTHGTELWKSDGTVDGTVMVADLNPGDGGSDLAQLTDVDGTLFFAADDGTGGTELWRSDGTEGGTVLLKNLGNNPYGGPVVSNLTNVSGTLYFTAFTDSAGWELWKSDGTEDGTTIVKDIFPGSIDIPYGGHYTFSSNPSNLTAALGTLFFTANDGTNGVELWKSDGTELGTAMVKDIRSDSGGSYPGSLTNLNGTLYFSAFDVTAGWELWKSDGTESGTVLVKDANPGSTGSYPGGLTSVDGTLYFAASDGVHGIELWALSTTLPSLAVSGFSTSTAAGALGSFTVTAENADGSTDSSYTGTVHFASSDGQAELESDYTFTPTDAGVHTFTATLKTAGAQSLTVTDTAEPDQTGTQSGITVLPGAASQLILIAPAGSTAGTPFSITVTARDAYDNTAASYTGTVAFATSDGQASLPVNYVFLPADAGAHTFTSGVALKTAGNQIVTVNDGVMSPSEADIAVTPAAVSQLVVSAPAGSTAGSPFSVTVTAIDAYNNTAAYAGTIQFQSSDGHASGPAAYTFRPADAGVHTFTDGVTLKTAGGQTVEAGDGFIAGSTTVEVSSAAASTLVVTAFPSLTTAGVAGDLTVTLVDPFGNIATSYAGTVQFTSSDRQADLPGAYTFVTGDAGVHTFTGGVALKTAGSQTITAGDGSITGSEAGIAVIPAAVSQLLVTAPVSTTAGETLSITVAASDAYNNIVSGYAGTISFSSSDGQAGLSADYTFLPGDAGVHTFTGGVVFKTAGGQTVTAGDGAITGSAAVVVSPSTASKLTVFGFPSPTTAGANDSFTVAIEDAYGNIATSFDGTVHFTSSDGHASLPAEYTFLSTDAGVHTFTSGVALQTAGSQTVSSSAGALTGSATVVVSPAAASKLIVSGFPSPTTAGVAGSVTVTAKDAYGNIAASFAGTVQLTSSDGQASLAGAYTFVSTDGGVHTFAGGATLKTAGNRTVTVSDGSIAGSVDVVVSPAAATRAVLSGLFARRTAKVASGVTVTFVDAYGNIATGYAGTVQFRSTDPKARIVVPSTGRRVKLQRFTYAFKSTDRGVHEFSVILITPGRQSITVMAATNAGLTVKAARRAQLIQRR